MNFQTCLLCFLTAGCLRVGVLAASTEVSSMPRVVVAADNRGFVLEGTAQAFHPWGMNYGHRGQLMEDFWDTDWEVLSGDFRALRELGANVVRVHLQYGKFMHSPAEPNRDALRQLVRLLRLAEETGLRLDITGLACYRPVDTPEWYEALDEPARWAAQARFWESVAEVGKGSPAVFCYDLINEPLSPATLREPRQWRSGSSFGGFDFLQSIALDPAGRKREDIAVSWIRQMTAAIRRRDGRALITVGSLPWSRTWKYLSGFLPEKIAPELDFLSVHIYPETAKPGEALECLEHFQVGKPVVIEETFPLSCGVPELEEFLRQSKVGACGWIGHYDGQPVAELDALKIAGKLTPGQTVYRGWLRLFARLKPEFCPEPGKP